MFQRGFNKWKSVKEALQALLQLETRNVVHYGNAVFQDRAAPKHCHVVGREGGSMERRTQHYYLITQFISSLA